MTIACLRSCIIRTTRITSVFTDDLPTTSIFSGRILSIQKRFHHRAMSTGKRIVFTGGSGKAGRHVIPELLKRGHQVLNLDLVPLDNPNVFVSTRVNFNRIHASLRFRVDSQDGPYRCRTSLQCAHDTLQHGRLPRANNTVSACKSRRSGLFI